MASTITAVAPASAYPGQTVTLTGTGLDSTNVDFFTVGTNPATISGVQTATSVSLIVPPGTTAGSRSITPFKSGTALTGTGIPASVTVVAAPTLDPLTSTLARKYRCDVRPAGSSGAYLQVRAVMDLKPDFTPTMQEDTDYDGSGAKSSTKTLYEWSLTMKLGRKVSIATGLYDPGQEVIRAAHDQFGSAGVVDVRWYDRSGGTEAYQGLAEVTWSPDGGDPAQLSTVSCTLTSKGVRNLIANPVLTPGS